jgi:hypothetical protein
LKGKNRTGSVGLVVSSVTPFRVTRLACALVVAAIALVAVPAFAAATEFQQYSPSDPDYPQKVDWVTSCLVAKTADDDPILYPGQPGLSHNHTFAGSLVVTASAIPEVLIRGGTNCKLSRDHASYWMPTLLNDGVPVMPYEVRAYYRAGTSNGTAVRAIPFGLRMIAGNAAATSPQDYRIAGFQCRLNGTAVVNKTALPPTCPAGAFLEASVVFPNCWNGKTLDSADHRSHMSYAVKGVCDSRHPVIVPQLTLSERFPVGSTAGTVTTAAMNSPLTLHADFMNAWDGATMRFLVRECINKGIACEDITDHRLPPGTTLPRPDPLPPLPAGTTQVVARAASADGSTAAPAASPLRLAVRAPSWGGGFGCKFLS